MSAPTATRPLREIEADCARINRELDLEHTPGYRRRIRSSVQPCPNRSDRRREVPDRLGRDPISGRCGITTVLRRGNARRLGWLSCGMLDCDECGPRLRRQRTDFYVEMIGEGRLTSVTIARSAWASLRRRLGRAGSNYLRFDAPGDAYQVLHSGAGPGVAVDDVRGELVAAFDKLPPGGRVSSSRAWALARQEQTPSGWHLDLVSRLPVEDVIEAAREFGMYAGAGYLKHTDDPLRWDAFVLRVGLHRPDPHRWWADGAVAGLDGPPRSEDP